MAFGRSREELLDVSPGFGGEDEGGVWLLEEPAEDVLPCGLEGAGVLAADGALAVEDPPASATGSDEWRQ